MTSNETKILTTKQKVLKVLFSLTFIPYIIVLILIIWGGVIGLDFFGVQNGLEGILIALLYILFFMVIIPIIPVCLIIQIATLVHKLLKKNNKNVSTKKFIAIASVVGIVLLGSMYLIFFGNSILEGMPHLWISKYPKCWFSESKSIKGIEKEACKNTYQNVFAGLYIFLISSTCQIHFPNSRHILHQLY